MLHWAILVTPGANLLVVMHLAASGSRRAAIGAACGIATVAVMWATLAVLGLDVIFNAHEGRRQVVQCIGGLYLTYVATRLWRSRPNRGAEAVYSVSALGGYRLGFTTNILNPKSALFFGGVFATTLPPDPGGPLLAMAVLLILLNALLWHCLLALTFSLPAARSRYARHGRLLSRTCSVAIGCFGASMILSSFAGCALFGASRGP
jgi:threonine efflux protein